MLQDLGQYASYGVIGGLMGFMFHAGNKAFDTYYKINGLSQPTEAVQFYPSILNQLVQMEIFKHVDTDAFDIMVDTIDRYLYFMWATRKTSDISRVDDRTIGFSLYTHSQAALKTFYEKAVESDAKTQVHIHALYTGLFESLSVTWEGFFNFTKDV
jgi:hypothetical protein